MAWQKISIEPIPARPIDSRGVEEEAPKTYSAGRQCPALKSDGSVCGTYLRTTNPGPNCDTHTKREVANPADPSATPKLKKTRTPKRPRTPSFDEMWAEIQRKNQAERDAQETSV